MVTMKRIELIEILFDSEEDKNKNWDWLIKAGWVYVGESSNSYFKFERNIL